MASTPRHASRTEQAVSYAILLVLVVVGVYVLTAQRTPNPAVVNQQAVSRQSAGLDATVRAVLLPVLPDGVEAMSPMEQFSPETLSDKINGKAELYLSAGVTELRTQRYRIAQDHQAWVEVFIFSMQRPEDAFSVFSGQRREDATPVGFARHAYRTPNALFFINGSDYVEMVATTTGEEMHAALDAMARSLLTEAAANATARPAVDPDDYFPKAGLLAGSITRIAENGFGFHRLDNLYLANYGPAADEMTAFVSRRSDPAEASELAAAYGDFLLEFGGREITAGGSNEPKVGLLVVEIMDAVEVVFTHGPFLAGVHMAGDVESALVAAKRLQGHLAAIEVLP